MKKTVESKLKIYDLFESNNGNLFLKVTENHSIAIGALGEHEPRSPSAVLYAESNDIFKVRKVGRLVFDNETNEVEEKEYDELEGNCTLNITHTFRGDKSDTEKAYHEYLSQKTVD